MKLLILVVFAHCAFASTIDRDLFIDDYLMEDEDELYRRAEKKADCWIPCGKTGDCDFCGYGKACCRIGWNDPPECHSATGACNGYHCCAIKAPIDGGYSKWKAGVCSVTCGKGTKKVTRTCTNPKPEFGGKKCTGESEKTEDCDKGNCPIDGGLTDYKVSSSCSVSCGEGTEKLTRTCTNPKPQFGGKGCDGPTEKTQKCKKAACPVLVDGGYGSWTKASECSVTCGTGTLEQTRTCDDPEPQNGGKPCKGPNKRTRSCYKPECPIDGGYSTWKATGRCSKKCGKGEQTFTRKCDNPYPQNGGKNCQGPSKKTEPCEVKKCIAGYNCWKHCNNKAGVCETGYCKADEVCCRVGWNDPDVCKGAAIPKDCGPHHCCSKRAPIHGGYTDWKKGACSATCGKATRQVTRTCTNPKPQFGGKPCSGPSSKTEECTGLSSCYVPYYSAWENWSPCTKPCAGGTRTRTRNCLGTRPAGGTCNEEKVTEPCNVEECAYCEKPLEAGIILDRSGSVANYGTSLPKTIDNWHLTLDFAMDFLKAFGINPYNVHFGAMRYSNKAFIDAKINDPRYWSNDALHNKLASPAIYNTMPYGGTFMGYALKSAEDSWFCNRCGLRPGVPRVLVLFTDGVPNGPYYNPIQVANELKSMGVKIVAVGIGKGADMKVLNAIATDPSHVFDLEGFDYMEEKINKMVKLVCYK